MNVFFLLKQLIVDNRCVDQDIGNNQAKRKSESKKSFVLFIRLLLTFIVGDDDDCRMPIS